MRNIILKTDLQADEILDRLNSVTERFQTDSGKKYLFEGKITGSGFHISQTFDYGARDQLRPEIKGSIRKGNDCNLVELRFGLPHSLKILFIVVISANLGFIAFLFLKPMDLFFTWKFALMFFVVTFLIFYLNLKAKIKSAINVLSKTLEAEAIIR